MDNTLFPLDRQLSFKEILTYWRNDFAQKLMANIIDIEHYKRIKEVNPEYKTVVSAGPGMPPQQVTIDGLITKAKMGATYARDNVKQVDELLAKEKAGTLAEKWSEEELKLIVSPIQQKDIDGQGEQPK